MGGGGGITLGALIVAHALASGVAGLLSSLVVCYGIFKGTKNKPLPRSVAKSFRPVSVCSPLAAIEPGSAQLKLTSSQEISQFLPPSTYAYRKGFSPSMPVFAARVAVMISLDLHQSVAIGDFDCSDAFFRVARGELSALLDAMPDTWNFGRWAAAFFRQVQVVPVTADGLAPPYTTGEGFNQGMNFSAVGFQSVSAVVDACLPLDFSIAVPSPYGPLPLTMLSFSDDRRPFRPTLQQLVAASLATDVRARSLGEVVHGVKQDFTLLVVLNGAVVQVEVSVPGFTQKTASCPPSSGRGPYSS